MHVNQGFVTRYGQSTIDWHDMSYEYELSVQTGPKTRTLSVYRATKSRFPCTGALSHSLRTVRPTPMRGIAACGCTTLPNGARDYASRELLRACAIAEWNPDEGSVPEYRATAQEPLPRNPYINAISVRRARKTRFRAPIRI